ncbi:MAG: hypothetical protein HON55_03680 [Legionellales bacterium]|jgi:membrane protein required for colicin V production|nr:hypothetical protein [Legionellales bacterium]
MNVIDFGIIAVMSASCIISLLRGFIKEVVSLVSWILAFSLSTKYAHDFSSAFSGSISNSTVRFGLALVLIFVFVLVLGLIINKTLGFVVSKIGLGPFDKVIGIFFGFIRGVLIVSVIVFVAMMTSFKNDKLWKKSELIPNYIQVIKWLDVDAFDLPDLKPGNFDMIKI